MGARLLLAVALAGALPTVVEAADAPAPVPAAAPLPLMASAPLPSMALDPQVPESLYHGLYVGTEVFGVAGHGVKGGVGGDVFAGYDRVLDNDVLVGFQGTTGYAPSILGRPGLKGFDFGEASARIGYAMGRFTPFVTAGLVVARPVTGGGLASNNTDSFNDLLNGSSDLIAAPRIGAGVAYALTSNASVAFGVSVGRGAAAAWP